MGLSLRRLGPGDGPRWDELVHGSPQGSVFLEDEFLALWTASEPGLHGLRFGCFDGDGRLVGGQLCLHRRKAFGLRVQTTLNFPYNSSPILAGFLPPGSPESEQVLRLLARQAERLFPVFTFECHPSLQDVRPLLELGWRVTPEYAHAWDLRDHEALLRWLGSKSRFRQANDGLGRFLFADETGPEVAARFPAMFHGAARRFRLASDDSWGGTFLARITWLMRRDAARLFTCRRMDGTLLGILIFVLSPAHQSTYGWLMAYDFSMGDRDFLRSLYLYSLRQLAGKAGWVDIAEGIRPTLYDFKDSLGSESSLYFMVQNPKGEAREKAIEACRRAKRFLMRSGQ